MFNDKALEPWAGTASSYWTRLPGFWTWDMGSSGNVIKSTGSSLSEIHRNPADESENDKRKALIFLHGGHFPDEHHSIATTDQNQCRLKSSLVG